MIGPTSISDITPTATPAIANIMSLRRTVHGSPPWSSSSWAGLNRCAWVFSENSNAAPYDTCSTSAIPTDRACTLAG